MHVPKNQQQEVLPQPIAIARATVLASFCLLVVYFAALSFFAFKEIHLAMMFVWLLQTLPLLIFAPGLFRTHLRTYGWLCFVVLLYFIHAVLVAFDPSRRVFGIIEVLLCTSLFCALVVFIRSFKTHFHVNI